MSDYAENISNSAAYIEDDRFRHWSSQSQAYAPADVLLNHMREGWVLDSLVAIETFSYAGIGVSMSFTLRYGGILRL